MAIAWNAFAVSDEETIVDVVKHPNGFRFFNCRLRNDEEIASRAVQLYPVNVFNKDYDCYHLRNILVKRN